MTNADAYLKEALQQRDKYWEGISERTRALCLGTLVLIWGILSQKATDTSLTFDAHSKIDLLRIAACVVVVLGLDFVEYLAAFGDRRKLAGDKTLFPKFRFDIVERTMRVLKVVLGLAALVGLCIVLSRVLLVTVHAQTNSGGKFFGTWCGGDRDEGTWSCLRVTNPESEIVVEFNFQGKEGWITCKGVDFPKEEVLDAVCGRAVTQTVWQSSALIEMHLTIEKYEDTRLLYKR